MGVEALVAFGVHSASVWGGAKAAGIKRAGLSKALMAALLSYAAMLVLSPLFFPLRWIPFLGGLVGALVLALGTAVAAKVVLNCEWKQAQKIGLIAALVNLIFVFSIGRWI